MARSTRACAMFRVQASMEARLSYGKRKALPLKAGWKTEEEYSAAERARKRVGWQRNAFAR